MAHKDRRDVTPLWHRNGKRGVCAMGVRGQRRKRGWTASGAARQARDARIATAGFFRDAPAAREWNQAKLMAAYQTKVNALRLQAPEPVAREVAMSLLLTGLGYAETWSPEGWDEVTNRVVADEARYLAEADLYVLSPQLADVVVAAAQTLTIDDLALMTADDLPSRSGLLLLPHPLLVRAVNGALGDERAYLWRTPAHQPIPDLTDPTATAATAGTWVHRPAVRVSTYHDSHGPVQPDSFLEFAAHTRGQGHPLPPLLIDGMRCFPFEMTITDEQRANLATYSQTARTVGGLARAVDQAAGHDEDRVVGEYTPGSEIVDEDDTFQLRFLYAFWRLCEQRIADTSTAQARHAAQLQADRAGVSSDVRVVQLRPTAATEASDDGSDRWHHRWVVRMHKVRQWYPSEQRHKVIYRGPYLKGPDDKPLLGGDVVRGLTK